VREASALRAGVLMLPAAAGIAAGSAGAPLLARRLGARTVVPAGMLVAAAGFCASITVGRTTATWFYESCILAVGLGVGAALAPATEVVMAELPPDRPGAGAAMNGTLRLVGASLGVAVLGALLAGTYRQELGDAVSVLPPGARSQAAGSIGATATAVQQVADAARQAFAAGHLPAADGVRLRAGLTALLDHADDAYVVAMHRAVACGAAVSLLGALVAVLWLPGRRPTTAPDDAAADDADGGAGPSLPAVAV